MPQVWQTKDGTTAILDDPDGKNLQRLSGILIGKYGNFRMIWDKNTKQAWGPEEWDLKERIGNADIPERQNTNKQ